MSNEQPQLTEEQLAAMAMHEEMHKFFAGHYTGDPKLKPTVVATDMIVNGPNGKTLNWPDLMIMESVRGSSGEMLSYDTVFKFFDKRPEVTTEDMNKYMTEIEKIKRLQAKINRMGYRRAKAEENKARRKAKKRAKRT